jgi:hypothetical protein
VNKKNTLSQQNLIASEDAIDQLIIVARQQFAVDFPDGTFDAFVWDAFRWQDRPAAQTQRNLYFTRHGTLDEPLPERYAVVIKSWIVLGPRSITFMKQKIAAARILWEVLLERCHRRHEDFRWHSLCLEDFCQAELLMLTFWLQQTTYGKTLCLIELSEFLQAREICQPFHFTPQTPPPVTASGYTFVERERGAKKLPSQKALQGLADIYHKHTTELPDRLRIAALAILVVAGFRMGELLTLPVDCEIEEERSGKHRYGLQYYKEKSRGGAKKLAVRWLTPIGAELAKDAIAKIRTITTEFRERACLLEQDPNRVPIPGFNWADKMRTNDVREALKRKGAHNAVPSELLRYKDTKGNYFFASEVEAYLLSKRTKHLWTLDRKDGTYQALSETLLIAAKYFFVSNKETQPLLIEPIKAQHLATFLTTYTHKGGKIIKSAFERFDIKENDGTFCRMTSHQLRHWLNDLADKGGLPVEQQTRWMGREHAQDTEAYRHATVEERLQWVKNGIRNDTMDGFMADVYAQLPEEERDIFLEGQIQAVHFTALGLCLHDFCMEPCPYHLNCTRGCRDYLRRKGNKEERRNLTVIQHQAEKALKVAQEQVQCGNGELAEPWIRNYQETLEGVKAALAVDDDSEVEDGTIVQPFKDQPSRFQSL